MYTQNWDFKKQEGNAPSKAYSFGDLRADVAAWQAKLKPAVTNSESPIEGSNIRLMMMRNICDKIQVNQGEERQTMEQYVADAVDRTPWTLMELQASIIDMPYLREASVRHNKTSPHFGKYTDPLLFRLDNSSVMMIDLNRSFDRKKLRTSEKTWQHLLISNVRVSNLTMIKICNDLVDETYQQILSFWTEHGAGNLSSALDSQSREFEWNNYIVTDFVYHNPLINPSDTLFAVQRLAGIKIPILRNGPMAKLLITGGHMAQTIVGSSSHNLRYFMDREPDKKRAMKCLSIMRLIVPNIDHRLTLKLLDHLNKS